MQVPSGLIVLAEDDADVRDVLAHRFEQAGYEVKTAAHGAEAIELLQHQVPAAIFVDLILPGVVGHSVLEFIRSQPTLSSALVAIVSGSPELAPAGYPVFKKPVPFSTLLAFVQRNRPALAD